MSCKENRLKNIISVVIQVTFIFTFLTVFFFLYVQGVEKTEFQNQLYIIVDDLMKDNKDELRKILGKSTLTNNQKYVLIAGAIDMMEEKISQDAKDNIQSVNEQNYKTKLKALQYMVIAILGAILLVNIFILFNICIPLEYQIKEAMIVIIFVGLTEFCFLQLIASRYISANPNDIKRTIGVAVEKWIQDNKKI
jgi:hypothetical protein